MRRMRTAGLGLAAALTAQAAVGQDADRPAARLGVVRPAAQLGAVSPAVVPAGMIARGQDGRVQQANGTGSVSLTMPQPAAGPSVTESRGGPIPPPPAGVVGSPQPTVIGVGQPFLVGSPTPGQPIPVGQPFPPSPLTSSGPFVPPPAVGAPVAAGPVGFPAPYPSGGVVASGPARPGYGAFLGGPTGLLTGGGNFLFSADYLLWYVKSSTQPTLFTTGPTSSLGIIGQPGTTAVLGGPTFQDNLHGGARFGAQYWFGQQRVWGISGDLFFLGRNGETYEVNSAQYPLLARPFYNQNENRNDSELVAFPGAFNGAATVTTETSIFGGGVDFRRRILGICGGCSTLDLLAGFRGLKVSEGLSINEYVSTPTPFPPRNAIFSTVSDSFQTENQFYGFNTGIAGEVRRGRWFLNGKATVALGDVFEQLTINGSTVVQRTTGVSAQPGGLYALPGANIGTFSRNRFAVLPEVGVQVGYFLTPHWRVGVGYNFLYLSNMIRPADQIDPGLDVTRIPDFVAPGSNIRPLPSPRPAPTFKETDFFMQGISFSLQFLW
jgi:hypothetical protein